MLALLVPPILAGALAGPSFLAVSSLTAKRPFAPLVRGSLERSCVLAAAGLAAVSAAGQVLLIAGWFAVTIDQLELFATPLFFLLAPPIAGAAPWVAGEMLSGPSRRDEESLAAALATAYLAAALGFGVALPAGLAAALAAAGASATILAAFVYLAARGPAA
jgi:hypothetical protein